MTKKIHVLGRRRTKANKNGTIWANRIMVSGWYGAGNTGDEAILTTLLDEIECIGNKTIEVTILCEDKDKILKDYGSTYKVRALRHIGWRGWRQVWQMTIGGQLFQILKELSRCDIFFFGGGGLLKDNTSPQNVLKLLDEAFLAKLLKKKLVFGGVGVGPVVTGFGKWLIKMAANVADQIFVRDQLSRTRLLEIGIRDSKIRVAGDIGILLRKKELLYGHPLRKLLQEIENSCFKKVGICLCDYGLRSHLLEDESPESDKLFRALGKFCDWLVENINAKLLFIPFMTEYWDDDRKTAIRVKSEMKRGESAYEVKSILSPRELKWVLGKLDYVIGARLHSIVLAASEGVPAVALSYDAKVRGFMEEMDLKTFIIDVGSLDPERMIEIFKNIENGRGNYIDRMKPNAEAMKKAVTEMLNEALRLP